MPVFNNIFGASDIADSERQAGETKLRCVAIQNMNSSVTAKNLKLWIGTLGTQQLSDAGQLPASGTGNIQTTGSFIDWPETGYCRIATAVAALKEIVYYSSRSETQLNVPAAGRGLLGTSAAAGAADDLLDAVPGIRIAAETPVGGNFSVAYDENDTAAVEALGWSTAITEETGIEAGDLAPSGKTGLWIWMEIIAGQTAEASLSNIIRWSFSVGEGEDQVNYLNEVSGRYRIADDSLDGYELYRGVGAEPNLTASPWETFTSLPHETAALEPEQKYYFVLRRRNKYNLVSQNVESWSVELDAEGDVVEPLPDAPQNITITPAAEGTALITAQYLYELDDDYAATHWLVYFTNDGDDPDPENDTPQIIAMQKIKSTGRLKWTSSAADNGDTLKVLVRVRRVEGENNYDSDNVDIYSATASTQGPDQPRKGRVLFHRAAEAMQG